MVVSARWIEETPGRGTVDITRRAQAAVARAGVDEGLCTVFTHHTSCSLILCENADPAVRRDLEAWAARIAPDGDPTWEHSSEGPDDMSAHIRSIITQPSISIPIRGGRLDLGTWQGLYLWEHRARPHTRRLVVHISGI